MTQKKKPLSLPCPPISEFTTRARGGRAHPIAQRDWVEGGVAMQISALDRLIRRDGNVMCRMLIQAQSNIICSIFPLCLQPSLHKANYSALASDREGRRGERQGRKRGVSRG